jgi:pyruvate formate lyase activating enzyme
MVAQLRQSNYPGRWWAMLPDGRVECRLCPRFCKLNEGQRGFCFVRQRVGDRVVLSTYGRSSGFCVDPIEKKPLNHFLPGTSVLSFGTAGCNLGCRFCQNWDISKAREWDRLADSASPKHIALAAERLGCQSVAFTYNDPVIFAEYAIDVAQACRGRGIKTVAVTAGYITDNARPEFYRHMDAANVDLKAFTDAFYHKLCFAQLEPVLETLKYLRHETNVWFEVTTLLIPGENDGDAEIDRQNGSWEIWARMFRGISPRSIPISRCSTNRTHQRRRLPVPARSRAQKGCTTFIPETFTIAKAAARRVPVAVNC